MSDARLPLFVDLASAFIALVIWFARSLFGLDAELAFWVMEVFFSIYVCLRLKLLGTYHKGGILTPIGILFLFQFLVQGAVGNLSLLFYTSHFNAGWDYLFRAFFIIYVSAVSLMFASNFTGCCGIGSRLASATIGKLVNIRLNIFFSVLFLALSTVVYVYSMSIGVIGYSDSSNLGSYESTAGFAQYLIYVADIGYIVLLFSYYVKLSEPWNIAARNVFYAALVVRTCLALVSGMRSELFFIVICMAIMFFIVKRRIPKWIILVPLVVLFSYGIYDSFRSLIRSEDGSRMELLLTAASSASTDGGGAGDTVVTLLTRLNISESLSAILRWSDANELTSNDPTFLLDLVLLPITTFLPRSLFPWKSMSTYGLWVTRTVYGMPDTVMSSSYVTVEGFYYLAGGMLLVVVGFFTLGLFLEFVGGFLRDSRSNPVAATVFLMLCYKVLFEVSTPIDIVTPCIRGMIIFGFASYLLVLQKGRSAHPSRLREASSCGH